MSKQVDPYAGKQTSVLLSEWAEALGKAKIRSMICMISGE